MSEGRATGLIRDSAVSYERRRIHAAARLDSDNRGDTARASAAVFPAQVVAGLPLTATSSITTATTAATKNSRMPSRHSRPIPKPPSSLLWLLPAIRRWCPAVEFVVKPRRTE